VSHHGQNETAYRIIVIDKNTAFNEAVMQHYSPAEQVRSAAQAFLPAKAASALPYIIAKHVRRSKIFKYFRIIQSIKRKADSSGIHKRSNPRKLSHRKVCPFSKSSFAGI